MRQSGDSSDGWRACRGGEIGTLVRELRLRRVREFMKAAAFLGAFFAFGATTALGYQVLTSEPVRGGLTCSEVRPILKNFADGLLSSARAGRIATHLVFCPNCQFDYNKMRNWNLPAPEEVAEFTNITPEEAAEAGWTASEIVERMLEDMQPTDAPSADKE